MVSRPHSNAKLHHIGNQQLEQAQHYNERGDDSDWTMAILAVEHNAEQLLGEDHSVHYDVSDRVRGSRDDVCSRQDHKRPTCTFGDRAAQRGRCSTRNHVRMRDEQSSNTKRNEAVAKI